jgi:hypothetical protein
MMTNPLLQKYEELYGKKEEPKPDYYKGEKSYAEELKELRDTSCVPVNTPNIITKANHIPSLTTYDYDSGKDSFLQIAEKVKNGKAKVSSVSINADAVGGFNTGLRTYTFEVMEWDTP